MIFYPTKIRIAFLCFIFSSILLNFACSKDSDLLVDSILDENAVTSIQEKESTEVANDQIVQEQEVSSEEDSNQNLEIRTASFSPIHDAHIQSGKGYNQSIIRLEEGHRTSYLMFDLSPIGALNGKITDATLQFTINSDDGNGTVTVFKGASNNWTENNISDNTAPEIANELGSVAKEYIIGTTEVISLNPNEMNPELATLILNHAGGNDLAFASKEHEQGIGPKLVLSYEVAENAEEIEVVEEAETSSEESSEEQTNEDHEPIAIADATPSSGGMPLEVSFTGSSSTDGNGLSSYSWDFKDGSISTLADPNHTFTDAGIYEVILTVVDEAGLTSVDTVMITVTETANEAPNANVDANPKSGNAPLEVSFIGSGSTDDHAISSYLWDFKDGSTATEADPKHTFIAQGDYEVLLTVKDENGLTSQETILISVANAENVAPIAVVTSNAIAGDAPVTIQFIGSNSTDDKEITKYSWDFKDGSTATNSNPSHTFTQAGVYDVELTVEDQEGLKNSTNLSINVREVSNTAPVAIVTTNAVTGEAPLTVQFTGNNSTDDKAVIAYAWDFKDGSTASNVNPSHTFNEAGTYEVEFIVSDLEGLTDTKIVTIEVREAANNNSGGNSSSGNNGSYPSNAVYVSSYGFNSSDATNAMKEAINSSHSFIVVDKQASDWIVKPLNFQNITNKTIVFESGVVLRAKSGAFPAAHRLLQFTYSNNIEILGYGATFKMNKSEYTSGEQRHALSLVNSSNITIKGLTLRDSGGDGIYISRFNDGEYCQNILVEDIVSTNNKRQGMSVISVDGLTVKNSSFTNTVGKAPGAGVDFEPESTSDRLVGINFSNCNFTGNYGPGIQFALAKTSSSSMPIDATFRNSYVSNNYSTSNTQGSYPSEIDLGMSINNNRSPIKGNIVFDGLTVENSKWSAIWSKKTLEAYHVTIKNTVIKNISKNSNLPAIHIGILDYANSAYANMGGFTFENVLIDYDGVDASLELFGPSHGNWNLREMRGTIRVKSPSGIGFEDNLNRLATSTSSTVNLQIIAD